MRKWNLWWTKKRISVEWFAALRMDADAEAIVSDHEEEEIVEDKYLSSHQQSFSNLK